MDYQFWGRGGELVTEEAALVTAVTAVDTTIGYPIAVFVAKKGADPYAATTIAKLHSRQLY